MTPEQVDALFNTSTLTTETLPAVVATICNFPNSESIVWAVSSKHRRTTETSKKVAQLPEGIVLPDDCLTITAKGRESGGYIQLLSIHGPARTILLNLPQNRHQYEPVCWCQLQ